MARLVFSISHLCFDLAGNVPLLADRQNVVHQPVQYQTGWEPEEEDGEYHRHQLHDLGLHRIRRSWVQAHLQHHTGAHQDWQNEVGIHH